jgi:Cu/Ag efflux protein CusF
MRIATWRLALTGVTIVILLAAGIGFVAASTSVHSDQAPVAAAPSGAPGATDRPDESKGPADQDGGKGHGDLGRLKAFFRGLGHGPGHAFGLARRLVHANATVEDKDGKLVQLQLDHGTIASIGNGTVSISEAGGATITISTDATTVVRAAGDKASLSDLKVGDEIIAQSRTEGGKTVAKHVIKLEAKTGG